MKCRRNFGYHTSHLIDTCPAFDGAIDEKHRCNDCGTEWELRKLPNGEYYNDRQFYEAYAKDYLQPHHKDYELIYGDPTASINKDIERHKAQTKIEQNKDEIKEFKDHIKTTKLYT